MKSLVVGYGSIGKRHARLLSDMGHEVAVASRQSECPFRLFPALEVAISEFHPDYVVLANRTSNHYGSLCALAEMDFRGIVLVEKPLFDSPRDIPANRFLRAGVGYNLRFHPAITDLRTMLQDQPAIMANAYVGQYLPDWRPETDYRLTSSAHRQAGGGVLRDLSHELDYLNWLLGPWTRVAALGGRHSSLDIDTDDAFALIVAAERCPMITLGLNYLDRPGRRTCSVQTGKGTAFADLRNGTIEISGDVRHYSIERDATYNGEHRAMLEDTDDIVCSLEEGLETVELIAAAERAAAENIWVTR
jgi:predicted dehydrogenase